jgi:hypothetical protein
LREKKKLMWKSNSMMLFRCLCNIGIVHCDTLYYTCCTWFLKVLLSLKCSQIFSKRMNWFWHLSYVWTEFHDRCQKLTNQIYHCTYPVAPGLTGASWVVMRQIISNDTPPGLTDAEHPRNEKVFYCHFSTGMCKEIFKYSAII